MKRLSPLTLVVLAAVGCGSPSDLSKGDQETLQDRLSKPVTQHGTQPGGAPPSGPPAGGPPADAKPTGQIGE